MSQKPWPFIAVWALLPLVPLTGCFGPTDPSQRGGGDVLVYARAGESNRLDPISDSSGESVVVMTNVFDTLVEFAEDSADLVPGLAERWEPSDDGLEWTFHLREGVSFHDGTPLDAKAVKFSFERMIHDDPDNPDPKPYKPNYEVIDRVEVVSPRVVRFHLKQPSAVFLRNLAMFPAGVVSPAAVAKHGYDFKYNPVGTGPFRFDYWRHDEEIVLVANPDYFRGPPGVDRVVFVRRPEPATRLQMIRRGDAHIADNLPSVDLAAAAQDPQVQVQSVPGMNVGYLGMNLDKPALQDVRIREAIWRAIDKQQIIDLCYGPTTQAAVNPLPPGLLGYNADLETRAEQQRSYDPQAARKLLEDAGVTFPLRLRLFTMDSARPYMPEPLKVAQLVKQQLAKVGIEVQIVQNEISIHFQECSAGRHDLCLLGWTTDNGDPDNFLHQLLSPDNINPAGGNNVTQYRNEQVQQRLLQAKQELDEPRRAQLYHEAQELIFNHCPMVPLVHTPVECAQSPRVEGYKLHPTGIVRLFPARLNAR